MIFIIGGRSQGKLNYALENYGIDLKVYDLAASSILDFKIEDKLIISNLQQASFQLMKASINPTEFFKHNIEIFKNKIIIGNEIGSGLVPMLQFEREYRDETGRLYQFISSQADEVIRVFAGIGLVLKKAY